MNKLTRKYLQAGLAASGIALLVITGGCDKTTSLIPHKLVTTGGGQSVPLYPDEQTFLKVAGRSQQGGITGAVGSVQKDFIAKQVDGQTKVEVISSDSNGSEVQIADGPMKGQTGFVAPQNVD
jgi:hypothetical protein